MKMTRDSRRWWKCFRGWGRLAIALGRGWRCKPVMMSGRRLERLLVAVPDQTIGVDLHPSGLIHHGHDPAEAVALLGRRVLHVHACDAVRDLGRGQVIDVELGRGAADLPALLGQLEEFNYNAGATRGWVTIECPNSPDPVAEAGNAVEFLRSL